MLTIHSTFSNISKQLLLASFITAFIALFILEIYRLINPLEIIDNEFIRNSISIFSYILPPLLIIFLVIKQGTLIDMLYQSSLYAFLSWVFWMGVTGLFLFIKSVIWSSESILFSFEYIIPLAGFFFIFFFIGGLTGSIIQYIIAK